MKKIFEKIFPKKKISKKFFAPKCPKTLRFRIFLVFYQKNFFFEKFIFSHPPPDLGQSQKVHFFLKFFGRKHRGQKKEQNVNGSNFFSRTNFSTSFELTAFLESKDCVCAIFNQLYPIFMDFLTKNFFENFKKPDFWQF